VTLHYDFTVTVMLLMGIMGVRLSVCWLTGQDGLTNRWTTCFINQSYVAIGISASSIHSAS